MTLALLQVQVSLCPPPPAEGQGQGQGHASPVAHLTKATAGVPPKPALGRDGTGGAASWGWLRWSALSRPRRPSLLESGEPPSGAGPGAPNPGAWALRGQGDPCIFSKSEAFPSKAKVSGFHTRISHCCLTRVTAQAPTPQPSQKEASRAWQGAPGAPRVSEEAAQPCDRWQRACPVWGLGAASRVPAPPHH